MKKVLITGGTSGIGLATLKKLSKNYEIIFTYYKNEKEAKKLEDIYSATSYYLDLHSKKSIENLCNQIDTIDILINNASISKDNDFNLKSYEEFQEVIQTNLVGTYYLTKLLSKKINKEGSIIFISSTNGIDTEYIESIDYDASKAGIISLMHNFSQVLKNVRINTIAPGWVDTPSTASLTKEFIEKEKKKILLGRFAKPEEIANVIQFLISEEASYINNTVIRVDGGKYE